MDSRFLINMLIPLGFLVVFYFVLIRPQKKREKEIRDMRSNIKVGDEVITIGGIFGKIVKVKDDELTIEVGSDKTRFNVAKWAIGNVQKSEKQDTEGK
ncbi:protein translocase subunit yajC [Gottschalkia purinilytica]|uniref:Protein translocase subunit yajC n=1 Tax=Gottschalkia purinilytica TaxID=1503 RepID=A0A0L0WCT8_GOTPU|nr:preprotein translocase subunit YajC [Gottschalkia purinilytica]KNF09230.1 protein translocase subunit yajC [Gottschalkia purinilytica]